QEQPQRARTGREAARRLAVRFVARVLDAAAELHRDVRPRQLLVDERRRPALIDGRRQRFFAARVEGAIQIPRAEAALETADRFVRPERLELVRVVGERGVHLAAGQLLVLVAPDGQRGAERVERAREVLAA